MGYTPPKPWFGEFAYRTAHPIVGVACQLIWRARATGQEGIATSTGPLLLLPNHTSMFDPLWAGYFAWRRLGFMASAQLFRYAILSKVIGSFGAFPKAKFVKDRDAMLHLQRYWDMGHVILIFPEGTRTWDGRTRPVIPGIGRLVKRMDAGVVYCRIKTGHMHHPRWAKYPRWVPIHVEYDGPHEYPDLEAQEIDDEVGERIKIDPDIEVNGRCWGWRMAHGFPAFMWGCPACESFDALEIHPKDGNAVLCGDCGAGWRLDPFNRMHPMEGTPVAGQPVESVIVQRDRFIEGLGTPPVKDQALLDDEGVLLREGGEIGKVTRSKTPEVLARGLLCLTKEQLQVIDGHGDVIWHVALKDLVAVSFELAGVLQIRGEDGLYVQLTPNSGATMKWGHFVAHWAKAAGADKVRFG